MVFVCLFKIKCYLCIVSERQTNSLIKHTDMSVQKEIKTLLSILTDTAKFEEANGMGILDFLVGYENELLHINGIDFVYLGTDITDVDFMLDVVTIDKFISVYDKKFKLTYNDYPTEDYTTFGGVIELESFSPLSYVKKKK